MKLRLIFRTGVADYEGKHCRWEYSTCIVDAPDSTFSQTGFKDLPEVIGGEWVKDGQ